MARKNKEKKKGGCLKIVGIVVVVFIVLIIIGSFGGSDSSDDSSSNTTESAKTVTEATKAITAETTEVATEAVTEEVFETTTEASEATTESVDTLTYSMEFGDFVSAVQNDIDGANVLVVKAKITSSYDNEATINQNYYNVEDLIQNQGCDKYDEIQYWAVADMSSGNESKVISFTVNSSLIKKIANEEVVVNQLGDYVDDLYIHQSLQ